MGLNSIADRPWLVSSEFNENPGLSVYWIIQLVFIEPLKEYLSESGFDLPENIKASFAGYEPPGHSLTYEIQGTSVILNGHKGFITGAFESDWIFISARKPGEEKISSLIAAENSGILKNSLTDLKLNALNKVSTASLKLNNAHIDNAIIAENDPSALRRIIRSGNIMEKILILDMSVHLARHLLIKMNEKKLSDTADKLADTAASVSVKSYIDFKSGKKIFEDLILKMETADLLSETEVLMDKHNLSEKFGSIKQDISFLKKFLLT